jgi:hypothetical protein
MSLDYTCYALSRDLLAPGQIADASPDWLLEFVDTDSHRLLHRTGALPSDCRVWVWGCPRSSGLDLAALVRAGDSEGIELLKRRGSIGCCELEVESDFEAEPEFLADLPPRHRRILARAKSRYDTRTAAGRNDLSWRLQIAVCRAVALAVGGLLEEPQMGTFRAVAARG